MRQSSLRVLDLSVVSFMLTENIYLNVVKCEKGHDKTTEDLF